jgi:hypothetical protein
MSTQETRWIARLTPASHLNVDALLEMSLGLDVWERHSGYLIVAASDMQLSEIERRHLAQVEKLCTVAEFLSRQRHTHK